MDESERGLDQDKQSPNAATPLAYSTIFLATRGRKSRKTRTGKSKKEKKSIEPTGPGRDSPLMRRTHGIRSAMLQTAAANFLVRWVYQPSQCISVGGSRKTIFSNTGGSWIQWHDFIKRGKHSQPFAESEWLGQRKHGYSVMKWAGACMERETTHQ